ncbi:gamma-aminobutyric acid type B receptor subunit 2-like [Halichondria panicea]|uniref:gamma-aminobutyric acid type B receptor subunit 2-like n=1 Tax=Halichondria panicea TaxID=6063 RepID=UPI00312B2F11
MLSSSLFSLLCVTLTLICGGSTEGQNNDLPVYPTVSPDPDIGSLYFGLLVGGSLENSSVLAAVRLSLDIINNRSDILSGYSLHYTLTYSGCSGSDLVDKAFTQLDGRPDSCKKLGLITAGCTSTSLISSYVGNHFNVPEILCSQTVQSDARDLNVFRTHPSKLVLVPALVSIIASYEWTKVALMVENKQEYTPIIKELKEEVMDLNITFSVTTIDLQRDSLKVIGSCGKDIFDSDVRIFILVMSSEMTRHLLCQAFKQSVKYPKHEFVLVSEQNSNWWVSSQSEDGRYGCSSNQRADVLSHSLGLQLNQDYIVRKQQNISEDADISNFTRGSQAKYCYDAVWTLALALNKTVTEFGDIDCTYQDSQMDQLYNNIQETDFIGKTGHVRFTNGGERLTDDIEILVTQYQTEESQWSNLNAVTIGSYVQSELTLYDNKTIWPDGIPYDGKLVSVIVTVSTPLAVVYYLFATAGIISTLVCCVFNYAYRKTKIVRLTSPNLNYLIIIGCLFIYISVYWYLIPSTNTDVVLTSCCFQIGFLGSGYFLLMGTIVAKLWRIYYIFRNPDSAKKRAITDCQLVTFVLLLFSLEIIVLLVYFGVEIAAPGYELERKLDQDQPRGLVGERKIDTQYEFYSCIRVPNLRTVTLAIIYGTVVILQICALFMAIKTRKVQIKGLNDAKYIAAIVYLASFGSLIQLIATFTLRNRVNTYPVVVATSVVLVTMIMQGLVFIPKMLNLYRDPDGNHIFSVNDPLGKVAPLSTIFVNDAARSDCKECQELKARVKKLEQTITEKRQSERSDRNRNVTTTFCRHDHGEEHSEDDELEGTLEISWADDGSTFHIGHRV